MHQDAGKSPWAGSRGESPCMLGNNMRSVMLNLFSCEAGFLQAGSTPTAEHSSPPSGTQNSAVWLKYCLWILLNLEAGKWITPVQLINVGWPLLLITIKGRCKLVMLRLFMNPLSKRALPSWELILEGVQATSKSTILVKVLVPARWPEYHLLQDYCPKKITQMVVAAHFGWEAGRKAAWPDHLIVGLH